MDYRGGVTVFSSCHLGTLSSLSCGCVFLLLVDSAKSRFLTFICDKPFSGPSNHFDEGGELARGTYAWRPKTDTKQATPPPPPNKPEDATQSPPLHPESVPEPHRRGAVFRSAPHLSPGPDSRCLPGSDAPTPPAESMGSPSRGGQGLGAAPSCPPPPGSPYPASGVPELRLGVPSWPGEFSPCCCAPLEE